MFNFFWSSWNYTYPVCPVAPATTTVGTSSAIAGFDVESKVARAAAVVVVDFVKKSLREEVAASSSELFSETYSDDVDTVDKRLLIGGGARNAVDWPMANSIARLVAANMVS